MNSILKIRMFQSLHGFFVTANDDEKFGANFMADYIAVSFSPYRNFVFNSSRWDVVPRSDEGKPSRTYRMLEELIFLFQQSKLWSKIAVNKLLKIIKIHLAENPSVEYNF